MTGPDSHLTALLDVNLLVALVMPNHESHSAARSWFVEHAAEGWATTPMTESGFVRVCSNRRAMATATTPALALQMLRLLTEQAGHQFWPDSIRGVVDRQLDPDLLRGPQQVTDAHLLALAAAHGGRLVTFDRGIAALNPGTPERLEVLRPAR